MIENNICRLCKTTQSLIDLSKQNSSKGLYEKISNCLNLQMHAGDGLPTMICKKCKVNIKKFYKFKQQCLEIYTELKEIIAMQMEHDNQQTIYEDISSPEDIRNDNCDDESTIYEDYCIQNFELEDKTEIQCDICGSMFRKKSEYRKHLASHGETKLYQCKYCPKRFTRSETNNIHMRSHFGIKPFICDICGKPSTKRQDLIRHMKIHNDERNYECQICSRRFKRSSDLCSHTRTHSGVRPFKCNSCEKDYTSRNGLKKHAKTHMDQLL